MDRSLQQGDRAARRHELPIKYPAKSRRDERQCVSDVTYKGKHDKCQRLRCHRGGALTVTAAAARGEPARGRRRRRQPNKCQRKNRIKDFHFPEAAL